MMGIVLRQRWLLVALCALLLSCIVLIYDVHREPPAILSMRKAGMPVSMEALIGRYSPEPLDANGAMLYIQAAESIRYDDTKSPSGMDYGEVLTSEQRQVLGDYVAENRGALALIIEAQQKPFSRLPLDRYDPNSGYVYTEYFQALSGLLFCAAMEAAFSGDSEMLRRVITAELRMYEAREEGSLSMDEASIWDSCGRALLTLEYCLAHTRPPGPVLREWMEILNRDRYRNLAGARSVIRNETARSLSLINLSTYIYGTQEWPVDLLVLGRMGLEWSQYFYLTRLNVIQSVQNQLTENWEDPYQIISNPRENVFDRIRFRYDLHYYLQADAWFYRRGYRRLAHAAAARAALASLLYEEDHGRLPDTLEDLVPEYLDAVPRDPFTPDGTIRYRIRENHAVFYSVGPNEQDDGGTEPEGRLEEGGDIIFQLPLAERRYDES